MAVKKYHEIWGRPGARGIAALLAGCLAVTAWAGELRVEGLRLSFDAPWQRGDPQAEAETDSHLLNLEADGAALHLYLPRRATPLKTEADRFREQVARKWRVLYGDAALIAPRTLAGRDWLTCRRPGRDGRSTVFQWVTLQAGQAYNFIWFDDGRREELPAQALDLLARVDFPSDPQEPLSPALPDAVPGVTAAAVPPAMPEPSAAPLSPAGPESAVTPVPPGMPEPSALPPAADVAMTAPPSAVATRAPAPMEGGGAAAPSPTPASPPETAGALPQAEAAEASPLPPSTGSVPPPAWRLARVVVARPPAGVLEALAQLDARRLPPGDVLTGHGLRPEDHGLAWFLEGFRWEPRVRGPEDQGPAERKVRFRLGWEMGWETPPATLAAGAEVPLALRFRPVGTAGIPFAVRFQWLELCAADGLRQRAYAQLARGRHAPFERLLKRPHGDCPAAEGPVLPEPTLIRMAAPEAGTAPWDLTVSLPPPPSSDPPVKAAGVRRVLVLAVRFSVSESDDQAGDGLLRQAGVYYLYVPAP